MFNEKELLDKMNKDKDYRSNILIDLNVTLQFMEHYTDIPEGKISPREYKIAVVSLECENQELRQRIDKAIEYLDNLSFDGYCDGKYIIKELLEILKGEDNE